MIEEIKKLIEEIHKLEQRMYNMYDKYEIISSESGRLKAQKKV